MFLVLYRKMNVMTYFKVLLALLFVFSNSLALAKVEPLGDPSYGEQYDRIRDETVKSVVLPSDNYEDVDYIYKKQYLFLSLLNYSKEPYLVDAVIVMPRGPAKQSFLLLPCVTQCEILFKFDDDKTKSYSFIYGGPNAYALHKSQIQNFVKDMKKSKTVSTRVHSMSGYQLDYEFDLSKIEYDNLKMF